ncbi:MAG: hypothetical protein QOI59_4809 [Gammaproteobacteria bacterium]|nr:hypothetical protein [Gammaproteobacteria bacterium]
MIAQNIPSSLMALKINRLYYISIHTKFIACDHVFFLAGRCQHHDRYHFQCLVRLHLLQQLWAVPPRYTDS